MEYRRKGGVGVEPRRVVPAGPQVEVGNLDEISPLNEGQVLR